MSTAAAPVSALALRGMLDEIQRGLMPPSGVSLTRVSEMEMLPVEWLWQGRIPTGTFGLLFGREGIGKTQAWAWLVAQVTNGTLPGDARGPGNVLVVATEDDWSRVLAPRLAAAGADLSRVASIARQDEGRESPLSLPVDVGRLREGIDYFGARLVVLDPLLSRLGEGIDTHKDAEVRTALEPLVDVAQDTNATIIGLIHPNKSTQEDVTNTIMGSRAFGAVSRFVLYCGYVKQGDGMEDRRAIGMTKNSYGRKDWSIYYSIHTEYVGDLETSVLELEEEVPVPIESLTGTARDTGLTPAAKWLDDYLLRKGGYALKHDVIMDNENDLRFSEAQLRKARLTLGVKTKRIGGYQGGTAWCLPADRRDES